MRNILYLLLGSLFLTTNAHYGQVPDTLWSSILGGTSRQIVKSFEHLDEGGFLIGGASEQGALLIRTDSTGNLDWELAYSDSNDATSGEWAIETSDSNYALTGYIVRQDGSDDVLLMKVDRQGAILWQKTYAFGGVNDGCYLLETADNGFMIIALTMNFSFGLRLIHADSNGNLLWSKTYFASDGDYWPEAAALTSDGGVGIIMGKDSNQSDGRRMSLMRVDATGDSLWSRTLDFALGSVRDIPRDILAAPDDGFILLGTTVIGQGTNTMNNMLISKTSADGNPDWVKTYDNIYFTEDIKVTPDSGFIVTGRGSNDVRIMKTFANGDSIWTSSFDRGGIDGGVGVDIVADTGYAVAALSGAPVGDANIWLLGLERDGLNANFSADTLFGSLPFEVQFTDQSARIGSPEITTWEWDFDQDGIFDSFDQNPHWTYFEADTFSVRLAVSNEINSDTLIREGYISTYYLPEPVILAIVDVPNDQGGFLELTFLRSAFDQKSDSSSYQIEIFDDSTWTPLENTTAIGDLTYTVLVPTPADSNAVAANTFQFRVMISTTDGNFFSEPLEGYSVDNMAPQAPAAVEAELQADNAVSISWSESSAADFSHFALYRSQIPEFTPTPENKIAETAVNSWLDRTVLMDSTYYYRISALDSNFNESPSTDAIAISIVELNVLIHNTLTFQLDQNFPNPFNPTTVIGFAIPKAEQAELKVYNNLGEVVRTLVDRHLAAGTYQITWNATDDSGQPVASGTYFYRFTAGSFHHSRKMLLIR